MTARAMSGDRDRCLRGGTDGYLSQPIDSQLLDAVIEGASSGNGGRPATSPPIDRGQLLARLGGDEALLSEVIRLFLEDCPVRLTAIKTAIDQEDAESLRDSAHALKGAAGNLAATGLVNAAAALERLGAEGRLDAADA